MLWKHKTRIPENVHSIPFVFLAVCPIYLFVCSVFLSSFVLSRLLFSLPTTLLRLISLYPFVVRIRVYVNVKISFIHSFRCSAHASISIGSACLRVPLCMSVCALYSTWHWHFITHTLFIQHFVRSEVGPHRAYEKKSFDKPNWALCYSWIPIHANPKSQMWQFNHLFLVFAIANCVCVSVLTYMQYPFVSPSLRIDRYSTESVNSLANESECVLCYEQN